MPTISTFYGIIIRMFFKQKEHNPPHIHAIYGEFEASITIETMEVIDGYLPNKALALVREWIGLHSNELMKNWKTQKFNKIDPLE